MTRPYSTPTLVELRPDERILAMFSPPSERHRMTNKLGNHPELDPLLERCDCRIVSVRISSGRTRNYGRFKAEFTYTAELAEDADFQEVRQALFAAARADVEAADAYDRLMERLDDVSGSWKVERLHEYLAELEAHPGLFEADRARLRHEAEGALNTAIRRREKEQREAQWKHDAAQLIIHEAARFITQERSATEWQAHLKQVREGLETMYRDSFGEAPPVFVWGVDTMLERATPVQLAELAVEQFLKADLPKRPQRSKPEEKDDEDDEDDFGPDEIPL
jgi:hypothetical protein